MSENQEPKERRPEVPDLPFDYDIHLRDEDNVVGLVSVAPETLDHYDSVLIDMAYLKKMVSLADEVGWDYVEVNVAHGLPLLVSPEDGSIQMAVTPYYDDEDEDGDSE